MINPPTGRSDLVLNYLNQDNWNAYIHRVTLGLFRDDHHHRHIYHTLLFHYSITLWRTFKGGVKGGGKKYSHTHNIIVSYKPSYYVPRHVWSCKSGVNMQHKRACCYLLLHRCFAKKLLKFRYHGK